MNGSSTAYRTLWRWHFYAGLFCLPFILTLSLSDTLYLFNPSTPSLKPCGNGPSSSSNSAVNQRLPTGRSRRRW